MLRSEGAPFSVCYPGTAGVERARFLSVGRHLLGLHDRLGKPDESQFNRHQTLAGDSIAMGRILVQLMPDEPKARGLLAMMLHCEARRPAGYRSATSLCPGSSQESCGTLRIFVGLTPICCVLSRRPSPFIPPWSILVFLLINQVGHGMKNGIRRSRGDGFSEVAATSPQRSPFEHSGNSGTPAVRRILRCMPRLWVHRSLLRNTRRRQDLVGPPLCKLGQSTKVQTYCNHQHRTKAL